MKVQLKKISDLKNWDKNPRSIKSADYERLKNQIKNLGIYKPLLVTEDGTVLGGNMRIRAYAELGITEIPVVVVDAPTEAKRLEYALSDNDRVGFYEDQALAELVTEYGVEIDLGNYKVDLGETSTLADLLGNFAPGAEQPKLDEVEDKEIECPECGHKFTP